MLFFAHALATEENQFIIKMVCIQKKNCLAFYNNYHKWSSFLPMLIFTNDLAFYNVYLRMLELGVPKTV